MPQTPEPLSFNLKASLKQPFLWASSAGLIAAALSMFMPNYYRSEVRLLPVESKGLGGNLGGLASAAAAFGVNVPGGDSSDANYIDVLNSRWLKEQLLQTEFQYHIRSWRFGAEEMRKSTVFNYLESMNLDRSVRELDGVLTCSRDLKSKVITISAETKAPELSQLIVKRAVTLLEAFFQEKGRTRGGAKATYTEARLRDARQDMDEVEATLRGFLEGNRNYLISGDPAVRLRGARLEAELRLRQQLVLTLTMNREQALLEEKNDLPILNVLDAGNLPLDKSRPARSSMVLSVVMVVAAGAWLWLNRVWVKSKLVFEED